MQNLKTSALSATTLATLLSLSCTAKPEDTPQKATLEQAKSAITAVGENIEAFLARCNDVIDNPNALIEAKTIFRSAQDNPDLRQEQTVLGTAYLTRGTGEREQCVCMGSRFENLSDEESTACFWSFINPEGELISSYFLEIIGIKNPIPVGAISDPTTGTTEPNDNTFGVVTEGPHGYIELAIKLDGNTMVSYWTSPLQPQDEIVNGMNDTFFQLRASGLEAIAAARGKLEKRAK